MHTGATKRLSESKTQVLAGCKESGSRHFCFQQYWRPFRSGLGSHLFPNHTLSNRFIGYVGSPATRSMSDGAREPSRLRVIWPLFVEKPDLFWGEKNQRCVTLESLIVYMVIIYWKPKAECLGVTVY